MKPFLKIFFILLAAVFAWNVAKCATVFPIATNPAAVNFGGGVSFDGTNYFTGFLSGTNIVAQRLSGTNGSLLGSQIVVGANPGFPPAIAGAFGKTNYLLAWSDNSISGAVDMFGQFVSRTGTTNGLPKFPLLSSVGAHGFQTVEAMASDGTNFLVVWADGYNAITETSGNFYGQLVTPAGTLSGSEFLISSQHQNGNSMAVAFGKTNYLVVWQSNNNDTGDDNKTYGEFVSRSGVAGSPFQINQTNSTDQNPLAVAFDGTNYLVAWNWDVGSGEGEVDNWDIYGRLVSQTGSFPGNELHLVTDVGSQIFPALAFDGANYLMAWGSSPTGLFGATNSNVNFQFFNRSGVATNSEFTVFTAQGTNAPLFTYNGLIFDGTRFVAAATLGTVARDGDGNVTGFPSGEIFGAFIPGSTTLQVTTASLPDGTTTVPYSQTLTASGGQTPYTWTLVSNSLPAGLSLSGGGVISGTPTTATTTNFIVQVKDNTNGIATQALSLTIDTLLTGVGFSVTPAAVSNTYAGTITLQITGVNNGEKVTVQKFLDANTNGVIDAGDLLVEQGNLTDGKAFTIGGVTNINVPGDGNVAAGAITAMLNFQTGDFIQNTVGKYLLKLSSATTHFAPITNLFSVTNFPYAQKITGNVVNSGTNVPNAIIILFPPPRPGHDGLGNPVASTVANNSGAYTILVPAGSYMPVAFKSNFVANVNIAPLVAVGSGATVTTNLTLTNATAVISGSLVDSANSSVGLPGLLLPLDTHDGLLAAGFSDANGNFTVRVTADQWSGGYSSGLATYGYVGFNNDYISSVDTTTGSVAGLTVSFPKASAMFYGSVVDNFGNPVPGIDIEAQDMNGTYDVDAYSDQNGNYVDAVLGGLGEDIWQISFGNGLNPNYSNYVFSTASQAQNGGQNLNVGDAMQVNISAIVATNHITGRVQDNFGNPISGVGLFGFATINGTNYFPLKVDTDTNGNYAMNLPNGDWAVSINNGMNGGSGDGDDSLDSNYIPPPSEDVTIFNNNGILNFTVQTNVNSGGSLQITTGSLTNGSLGAAYSQELTADGGSLSYSWAQISGTLPSGLNLDSNGFISGMPTGNGTFNFTVQVTDQNDDSKTATKSFSLTINNGVLQVTTASLPNDTINVAYSQQLSATGGQPPYTWTNISGALPPGLTLATNGLISGTPTVTGTSNFTVRVKDSLAATATQALSLTVNPLATNINFFFTPAAVSNTYNGTVTLMVTGLVASETVTFQKYADMNTNGVIDGGDILEQQFQLTDGQASVFSGVTNFNVPNDVDTISGQITSPLIFVGVDNAQGFVGRHLYRLTSPTGHFAPITNAFTVTNFPFAQSISGNVVNNGTNVPNAIILLLVPSSHDLNLQVGTIANSSGAYSIKAPPGTYSLVAVKSNFVADVSSAPTITLGSGMTVITNLTLTNATQTISGRVADLNNTNLGLALLGSMESTNNLVTLGFYDANGNFSARVTGSQWKISSDTDGLKFYGYIGLQNSVKVDTTTGSVSSVSILLPKATAIIYGTVKDTLGNPLVGVHIFSQDNNNQYEGEAVTDPNGNYIAGALGGGTWSVQVDNEQQNPSVVNYVYSQALNQDGGASLSLGQALPYNFTAISATNHITGFVRDSGGNPLTNIEVDAGAQINGTNYQAIDTLTDGNGNYSLNVASGTWSVSVSAQNCSNSGDSSTSLGTNYQCPNSVLVAIAGNNGLANFTVQTNSTGTLQITTTSLPGGSVGANYSRELTASGGQPPYSWTKISGSLPGGFNLDSGGFISGTTTASGTFNFTAQVTDANTGTATKALSLFIQAKPSVASVAKISGGQFQFTFSGITNQNYTVQVATNLISGGWISLFTTNSATATSFNVADSGATNQQRFYRVLVGP